MKESSIGLINQIDDKDTALMEKVFLFLSTAIPHKRNLDMEQKRRMALVEKYCGAFAASQTDSWKEEKENYLREKYGQQ